MVVVTISGCRLDRVSGAKALTRSCPQCLFCHDEPSTTRYSHDFLICVFRAWMPCLINFTEIIAIGERRSSRVQLQSCTVACLEVICEKARRDIGKGCYNSIARRAHIENWKKVNAQATTFVRIVRHDGARLAVWSTYVVCLLNAAFMVRPPIMLECLWSNVPS